MTPTGGPSRSNRRGDARRGGRGRLFALVLVAVALACGGAIGTLPARRAPRTALQPAALASEAAPAGSVSSSWYCAGSPAADVGTTRLLLTNAGGTMVHADVLVVAARGNRRERTVRLGSHTEATVVPASVVHGAWLAARVEVSGGTVTASELVEGRTGRAVASCASEVSSRWYFASGSTHGGSTLDVSLFNPTPNLAVVDLSFLTSSGFTAPAPFQGVVVEPWALRTLTVGEYVQNDVSVATIVTTRAGAVVAGELQLYGPGGKQGVAFALGAPSTSRRWDVPGVEDVQGGDSLLAVLNPAARSEHVVVDVRLPTGLVAPFTQVLGPGTVWSLPTSAELRIATGEPYIIEVRASAPGVVVARIGAGARHGPAPWWAQDVSVTALQTRATRRWVVPDVPATAPIATAAARRPATAPAEATRLGEPASELVLENPGPRPLRVEVTSWTDRVRHVSRLVVGALGLTRTAAPGGPALVHASGPLAVVGDVSPLGMSGVVGIPAVPLR